MTLQDFIQSEVVKPFQLGLNDCAHFIARWMKLNTGKDPLIPFNGLPQSLAQELISKGKLARSVGVSCRSIGLTRTTAPQLGDVGVIRRPFAIQCAIKAKNSWIFFDENGVGMMKEARLIAAWRLKCQHQ